MLLNGLQAEVFNGWLKATGTTQVDVARELGVTRAAVSSWSLGRTSPVRPLRLALQALSGGVVPADGWERTRRKKRKKAAPVEVVEAAPVEAPVVETAVEVSEDYFSAG